MTELPLFPLSSNLLPRGRLSLQIFEQRYLDLVRSSMREDSAFGIIWIRSGSEIAQRGSASPALGDYGTAAKIIDWDQLPNGLLGITIEGAQRFDLESTDVRADGLVVGSVELRPVQQVHPMEPQWASLADVLRGLEIHPHIQSMNLALDYADAWHVGYSLIQLLPLDEGIKYMLLGIDDIDSLMTELNMILNQISGENDSTEMQ